MFEINSVKVLIIRQRNNLTATDVVRWKLFYNNIQALGFQFPWKAISNKFLGSMKIYGNPSRKCFKCFKVM